MTLQYNSTPECVHVCACVCMLTLGVVMPDRNDPNLCRNEELLSKSVATVYKSGGNVIFAHAYIHTLNVL